MRAPRLAVLLVLGVVTVAAVMVWYRRPQPARQPFRVPELSAEALAGQRLFDLHCARCHGEHAAGAATGPPLVDRTYQPAVHADVAFELAVHRGVPAHHWRFGNMPPQPEVPRAEVARITRYIRELQKANGIE
ncbi:MAG: cytochrome c [Candidatus Rokubacteria bacterium]|nr:cytochrome c [Candidatus Rokubacteria bacterium]